MAAPQFKSFLVAPESPVFSISTDNQPSLGNANAPVTIVAFTDYQCPSCAAIHLELGRLVKEYGDKVRLVTRDFPLSQHAEALAAAEAAEAAREQGKYWEYIQILMHNQSALSEDKLKDYASELALDRVRFDAALESRKFKEDGRTRHRRRIRLGVDSTPTVFINGRLVSNKSYEDLRRRTLKLHSRRCQPKSRTVDATCVTMRIDDGEELPELVARRDKLGCYLNERRQK